MQTEVLKEKKKINLISKKHISKDDLKEGEMICRECKGLGYTELKGEYFSSYSELCPKCQGKGIIDWIENIVGCKKDLSYIDSSGFFTVSTLIK